MHLRKPGPARYQWIARRGCCVFGGRTQCARRAVAGSQSSVVSCQNEALRFTTWLIDFLEGGKTGRIFARKSFEWNILTCNSFRWNILRGKVFVVPLLSIFCEAIGGGGSN